MESHGRLMVGVAGTAAARFERLDASGTERSNRICDPVIERRLKLRHYLRDTTSRTGCPL